MAYSYRSGGLALLGNLARLALQRPAHRAQLEGEAGQVVDQVVAVEAVHHELTLALAADQAGVLQDREMPRDRRRAHREALGELGGAQLSLGQVCEDLPPWRGCEGF